MLRTARTGRLDPRSDSGVSLAELVVTMAIMTVVGAMTTAFFVTNQKVSRATLERGFNAADGRIVLDSWVSMLRVTDSPGTPGLAAGRFLKITPTEIMFYSSMAARDGSVATTSEPTLIDLALTDGIMIETHYGQAGAPNIVRKLAANVTTPGWLFTPYQGSTSLASSDTDCLVANVPSTGYCDRNAPDGSGTVAGEATLALVNRIDLTFTVSDAGSLAPTTFTSSIAVGGT